MLKTYTLIALSELNKEELYSEKLLEALHAKNLSNYFEILDILKFNLTQRKRKITRVIKIIEKDVIILNNLTVKEFGTGHKNSTKIVKHTIDKFGDTVPYVEYLGLFTRIEEWVDDEVQVYLIPNYQISLVKDY